jgi:hypothetical protein
MIVPYVQDRTDGEVSTTKMLDVSWAVLKFPRWTPAHFTTNRCRPKLLAHKDSPARSIVHSILDGPEETLLQLPAHSRISASGPFPAGRAMDPKLLRHRNLRSARQEVGAAHLSSPQSPDLRAPPLLRRRAEPKKKFPLRAHGGVRWAPAAARRCGSSVAPWLSVRVGAAARGGFPFGAVRVPRG